MSSKPAPAYFGIGEVLRQLRPEFADVSTSKIRFLEAEGLIDPARSQSGYRRFAAADVERLRYILTAQRDEYLPLRVIKERLDALEGVSQARQAAVTRSELLDAAGIDESSLAELRITAWSAGPAASTDRTRWRWPAPRPRSASSGSRRGTCGR